MSDDEIFIDDSKEENREAFAKALIELQQRCKEAGIAAEEAPGWEEGQVLLSIDMPSGRDKYHLLISSLKEAQSLLSTQFEKYCMLGEYVGICCYQEGMIEATVRPLTMNMLSILRRRLSIRNETQEEPVFRPFVVEQGDQENPLRICLDDPSVDFTALSRIATGRPLPSMVLRIENATINTHDKALRLLERIANSLFFQMDLQLGIPVGLQRQRPQPRLIRRKALGGRDDLRFPERDYDAQPMSLYWYARSAIGMPLLQFLAYYQVIEFYMPTYSNQEALEKIRKIVKDPRFSPEKDLQVARILAALRTSARGFGDEKSQIEAVMRKCVTPDELRTFYAESDERKQFYEKDFKAIAPQKITLGSPKSDIILESAHRLYEIRCRIVHTKDLASERELPPLLPFSKEAANLYFDIELARFVATEILIVASTDFTV